MEFLSRSDSSVVTQYLSWFLGFWFVSAFQMYFIYWIMKMKVESFYWFLLDTKAPWPNDFFTHCPQKHREKKRDSASNKQSESIRVPFSFQSSDFYKRSKYIHPLMVCWGSWSLPWERKTQAQRVTCKWTLMAEPGLEAGHTTPDHCSSFCTHT